MSEHPFVWMRCTKCRRLAWCDPVRGGVGRPVVPRAQRLLMHGIWGGTTRRQRLDMRSTAAERRAAS